MKKVLGFYAHGRLGALVIKDLLEKGYTVDLIVRNPQKAQVQRLKKAGANLIPFDFQNFESIEKYMVPGVIVYVGGPFGDYLKLISFIKKNETSIKRTLFISSANAQSYVSYKDYKIYEDTINRSLSTGVIIKPTLIFGLPEDGNIRFMANWIKKYPFFPIIGARETLFQPVHYMDLKDLIVKCCEAASLNTRIFFAGGRDILTYGDMVALIRKKLGTYCLTVAVPIFLIYPLVYILGKCIRLPLDLHQISRADINRNVDISPAIRELGYAPQGFEQRLEQSLKLYYSAFN